jgi:hypothetical protein
MKKVKINYLKIITLFLILSTIFQSCTWKYDKKIVKDADGNLYRLEASGYRHESYDLHPLATAEIDSLLNKK